MCGSFGIGGNLGEPGPYKGSESPPHKRNPHSHVKEPPWDRFLRKLDMRYMTVQRSYNNVNVLLLLFFVLASYSA